MYYRKKPVVIEARQLVGSTTAYHAVYQWVEANTLGSFEPMSRIEGREPWPESGVTIDPRDGRMVIATLEGGHWCDPYDWVIRGVAGEFYPCKPDIFDATYEAVDRPHSRALRRDRRPNDHVYEHPESPMGNSEGVEGMKREFTLTAAEAAAWAAVEPGDTFWLVRPGEADLLALAAPCETCVGRKWVNTELPCSCPRVWLSGGAAAHAHAVDCERRTTCPDCRITLLEECPHVVHHREHLVDGHWHDSCPQCLQRRRHGGTGCTCSGGTVTLGYAYPVGGVQEVWQQDVPQRGTSWLLLCHTLGMDAEAVSALVGQYALELAVAQ